MNKTSWKFENNLPAEIAQAAKQTFRPVWFSALQSIDKSHNCKSFRTGLRVGEVTAVDQSGDLQTWEVTICESDGIMQRVHGTSQWQIHIIGK